MKKMLVPTAFKQPKSLTVGYDDNGVRFTKSELMPEIRSLVVNLSDVGYIQKDINMIVLPFFWFCRKTNYNIITYYFDDDKSKKMVVSSTTGDTIPTSFDYEVVQVLLKFRQAMLMGGQASKKEFTCTVWDVAKELGLLSKNKRGYFGLSKEKKDRIIKSVVRLKTTNYTLENLYNIKSTATDGSKIYAREERAIFSMLDNVQITNDLFDSEATFIIKFSNLFIESIEAKYHFTYELAKLDVIAKTSAKRLFELIDFRRHKKLSCGFRYKEIAGFIPLNSGRQNRVYINEYLAHLKAVGVIADYKSDHPQNGFTVDFLKDTPLRKANLEDDYLHVATTPQITNIEPVSKIIVEGEFTETETLFPLSQVQNSTVIESTLKEYNHEAYLADVSELYTVSGLSEDLFTSNLAYALKNHRKDGSFMAYFKGAVAHDWAKDERIKTELEAKLNQEQELQRQKAAQAQEAREREQQEAQQAEIDKELAEDQKCRDIFETLPEAEQKQLLADAEQKITSVFRSLPATSKLRQDAIWDEVKQILMDKKHVSLNGLANNSPVTEQDLAEVKAIYGY